MASNEMDFELGSFEKILEETDFIEADLSVEELAHIDSWLISSVFDKTVNKDMENNLKVSEEDKPSGGVSRFKSLTNQDLALIEQNRQSKSTKSNTRWGLKIFQDWCLAANGEVIDFKTMTAEELNDQLRRFYAEAAPKNADKRSQRLGLFGGEYHKNTLKNIRAAINRHLNDIGMEFDIVRDKQFKSSNVMLDAKLKSNLEKGLSAPTQHKAIISKPDLLKIASYLNVEHPNPIILRYKLWYDLALHFVSRGLEFHSQLTPRSFLFHIDEHMNREYVTLSHETKEKTRQGGFGSEEGPSDKRMYATNNPTTCPVQALKLFLRKTDPLAISLFNHCNKQALSAPECHDIWYIAKSVKKYQFSRFLTDISKQVNCSKEYTPHCLRATAIQTLSEAGFELRHIMYMSGHKNESSIRSYTRECSTRQKEALSNSLASIHYPTESEDIEPRIIVGSSIVPRVGQGHVSVSHQISNRTYSSQISAGIMSHSTFTNCTIQFYGNNNPME